MTSRRVEPPNEQRPDQIHDRAVAAVLCDQDPAEPRDKRVASPRSGGVAGVRSSGEEEAVGTAPESKVSKLEVVRYAPCPCIRFSRPSPVHKQMVQMVGAQLAMI